MQIATIEFARNVLGLEGAHSTEFNRSSPHPVISLLAEQKGIEDLGGTMRLGSQEVEIAMGSRAARLYGAFMIRERHRHRYEFNNAYRARFEQAGFHFSGTSHKGELVELIELADHPFFVACQFHPEFQSKPSAAHPLFKGFIGAVHQRQHQKPL
jgi:CTP synthase